MSTRREFLKTGGALVIGFSLRDELFGQQRGTPPGPDLGQIDTWIAIHSDNTATVHIGFCELGQGASTALPQIAAEELDLDMSQVKTVGLDTKRHTQIKVELSPALRSPEAGRRFEPLRPRRGSRFCSLRRKGWTHQWTA